MGLLLFILVVTAFIAIIFGRAQARQFLMWVVLLITCCVTVFARGAWTHQTLWETGIEFLVHLVFWTCAGGVFAYIAARLRFQGQSEAVQDSPAFKESASNSAELAYCIGVILAGVIYVLWMASRHFDPGHTISVTSLSTLVA